MTDHYDWPHHPIDRVVRQTGRTRGVGLRRRYDTSLEDMWDAWTSPDRLRRWLGEVTGDLAEGGTVTLDMDGEIATCTIIRCDPPHRLVANWSDAEARHTTAQLRLSRDGGRTLVELEHLGFDEALVSRDFGEGWDDFLYRLGQYVGGIDVWSPPWGEVRTALDPYWLPLADRPERDDSWPSVTVDDDRATLAVRRTYPASPHDVWTAMTDPKHLAVWFADVDVNDGDSGADGEGTSWRAVFNHGAATGTIQECAAERALVTTWRWEHEDSGSVLHVALEPAGDGTMVRIVQRDAPADSATGYGAGWYAMLAGLAIHLDGRAPTESDWDADFARARQCLTTIT